MMIKKLTVIDGSLYFFNKMIDELKRKIKVIEMSSNLIIFGFILFGFTLFFTNVLVMLLKYVYIKSNCIVYNYCCI